MGFTLLSSRLLHSRKSSGNPKMSKMETNGVTHHNSKGYLQPGDRAPEFKGKAAVLKNGDVSEVEIKLSNYLGKYVVFFFYPQDFTFVCPTEIIAFSERVEEFKKINCEAIGCSKDFNSRTNMEKFAPPTGNLERKP